MWIFACSNEIHIGPSAAKVGRTGANVDFRIRQCNPHWPQCGKSWPHWGQCGFPHIAQSMLFSMILPQILQWLPMRLPRCSEGLLAGNCGRCGGSGIPVPCQGIAFASDSRLDAVTRCRKSRALKQGPKSKLFQNCVPLISKRCRAF